MRRSRPDVGLLAGWLFADLLLAFGVVVFAASGGVGTGEASATSTTVAPTTTAPPPTAPPGVEQTPHELSLQSDFEIMTGPASAARDAEVARLVAELDQQLAASGLGGRRAALVLTFGFHPEPGNGQRLAATFNDLVLSGLPNVFGSAVPRNFDWRGEPVGQIRAEVYLFSPTS